MRGERYLLNHLLDHQLWSQLLSRHCHLLLLLHVQLLLLLLLQLQL